MICVFCLNILKNFAEIVYLSDVNLMVKITILTASQSFKTVAAIMVSKTKVVGDIFVVFGATILQLCSFSICTSPACKLLLRIIGTL